MENINTDTNQNSNKKNKSWEKSGKADETKTPSGNPDVNFGADEGGGSGGVEIDTGGLGDQHEIDLDRSGPHESGGGEESSHTSTEEQLETSPEKEFKKGTAFDPEGYSKSGGISEEDTTGYY